LACVLGDVLVRGLVRIPLVRLGVAWILVGCGSSAESHPGGGSGAGTAGGGSAGAAAGGMAGSTAAGGASGSGVTGGAAGSSTGGGSGSPGLDCSGAFGPPTGVLSVPGAEIGGLTLSADELEMIYGVGPLLADSPRGFVRSVRSSTAEPFSAGTALPELDAVCQPTDYRSGDLSSDGLSFYFVCYASFESPAVELRVARRAAPGIPFVVDAQSYGSIFTGPSISADELTLYTSAQGSLDAPGGPPIVHTRASRDVPFGAGTPLTALGVMYTPDVSEDGLWLFGSRTALSTSPPQLIASQRSSLVEPFGEPSVVLTREAMGSLGSAAISADCRSLYYVDVASDGTGSLTYTAMVLRR